MSLLLLRAARDVHVITLRPPPNYIGFRTEWLQQLGYINHFINTELLPSRESRKRPTKTQLYEKYFETYRLGVDGGPPLPFYRDSRGFIAVKKKEIDNDPDAFEAWEVVDEAYRKEVAAGHSFKAVDGDNAQRMLDGMMQDVKSDFRHALIMSNFTKTDAGKLQVRNTIMSWACFKHGVFIIEYSYKYLRITWNNRVHDSSEVLHALNPPQNEPGITNEDHYLFKRHRSEFKQKQNVNGIECGEFISEFTNINHMYSFLERFRRRIGRPIRTVCLAGEIGGRGVRYKGVQHEGMLTDMFLSFDVSKKKQIAIHGEALIQNAGRLCGIYDFKGRNAAVPRDFIDVEAGECKAPDFKDVPTVRLWIPDDCLQVLMRNLAFINDLVQMMAQRLPEETYIGMCQRIMRDDGLRSRFPTAEQVLLHATGQMGNGKPAFINPTRPNIMKDARELILDGPGVDAVSLESDSNRWAQQLLYRGDHVSTVKPLHLIEAKNNLQKGFEGLKQIYRQHGNLHRGPGAPNAPYILRRVEAIHGMSVHRALASSFESADGTSRQYSENDLEYDLKLGHLQVVLMELDLGSVPPPELAKGLLTYVLYTAGPEGLPFDAGQRQIHPDVSKGITLPRCLLVPPSILQHRDDFGACFHLDIGSRLRLDDDYFACDWPGNGAQLCDNDAENESWSGDEVPSKRKWDDNTTTRGWKAALPTAIGEVLAAQHDFISRTDLYEQLQTRLAPQHLGSPRVFQNRMRREYEKITQDGHTAEDGEFDFTLPTGKKVHCRYTSGRGVEYRSAR